LPHLTSTATKAIISCLKFGVPVSLTWNFELQTF
jgi:hypothetical protein